MATRWQSGLHHPVSVYAKQVTQGKLRDQCCEYEIKACQRHLDDLKRQGTDDFPYVFDTTRADRIIRWFGQCIQVRGPFAGQPVDPQPWQIFDQGCIYGWVHKDTGARRFNRTYSKRARGNVKSTEVSCKCLYHMCGDAIYPPYKPEEARFELEPEVECAAVDRGQAMRVFGDAKKALVELGKKGLTHVLCEGGLQLAVSLAQAGLVDEWMSVVSPVIIGKKRIAQAVRPFVPRDERILGPDILCHFSS